MVFSLRGSNSLKTRGISPGQFSDVLQNLLRPKGSPADGVPKRIGLAISGGVDSMALAVLCSKLKYAPPESAPQVIRDLRFQALIVDHGVRPDSREEAIRVSRTLKSQEIPSQILTIEWPEMVQPSELSNFETMARKYRFQALGNACRKLDIKHLMLAHHMDDQAESVLMRIIEGHKRRGLRGMKGISPIPECYGIHGVCRSGEIDTLSNLLPESLMVEVPDDQRGVEAFAWEWNLFLARRHEEQKLLHTEDLARPVSLKIEHGGVQVLRPLLTFSKKDLRGTCQHFHIPWFEDATNKDPTLTARNAVRHVLSNHSLPKAFDKSRLLHLAKAERDYAASAENLAYECRDLWARRFEPRTGTIIARFTNHTIRDESLNSIIQESPVILGSSGNSHNRVLQMLYLRIIRDIVESVSAFEHLKLSSFINAITVLFPDLHHQRHDGAPNASALDSFTVAGAFFTRRTPAVSSGSSTREGMVPEEHEWLISRQPYFSDPAKSPRLEIPSQNQDLPARKLSQHDFSLWDGRYWIRAKNLTTQTLLIRPLRKEDLPQFRSSLDNPEKRHFSKLLKTLAPKHIRFTLPAIAYSDGKVIALPSLRMGIPGADLLVEYDIRYKEVPEYIRIEYEEGYACASDDEVSSSTKTQSLQNPSPG